MKFFAGVCSFLVSFSGEIGAMELPGEYRGNQQNRNSMLLESNENDIHAETMADYTWNGEYGDDDEMLWCFTIHFVAEGETVGGRLSKNRLIKSNYAVPLAVVKQLENYKSGVKPLKHQKIRIKYEKEEPIMFGRLENFKCRDEQGRIIELDF